MMTANAIYLDYNATSPCAPEVVAAMSPYFSDDFANPSSGHFLGKRAARAVVEARSRLAISITATQDDVYFTSGATEANNMVILGAVHQGLERRRIVVTAIEHKSVLEPTQSLSLEGIEIIDLPVTRHGVVDLDAANDLINEDTLLVCVQGANNEIGTIQPVRAIAEIAHRHGALVHCDAAQMLGKVPVSVSDMDVDTASFSAHKVYGPKGIGALFIRSRVRECLRPVYRGGGQEAEVRPGTLNVPGVVGFGVASALAGTNVLENKARVSGIRDVLEAEILRRCPEAFALGSSTERLPNTSSICFRTIPADAILARAPLVCAGVGSACSSGSVSPSHVLMACGLTRDEARSAVRFSLGCYTTEEEVCRAIEQISDAVKSLQAAYYV